MNSLVIEEYIILQSIVSEQTLAILAEFPKEAIWLTRGTFARDANCLEGKICCISNLRSQIRGLEAIREVRQLT